MPTLMPLVCAWSLNVLKLSLQDICRLLPIRVELSVGGGATELTVMLPSTARLLAQVARAPVTVRAGPFVNGSGVPSGSLNNVNVSPGARLFAPVFFTVTVPAKELLKTPL